MVARCGWMGGGRGWQDADGWAEGCAEGEGKVVITF